MQLNAPTHKAVVVSAAVVIVVLNVAAVAVPALRANITPNALAVINTVLAGAVALLHALRQEGIITDAEVPGLGAILGDVTVQGDVNVIAKPDVVAAPTTPPKSS